MPNFQPINVGNILATGEGIKGARLKNQLAQQQLDPNSRENQLRALQLENERKKLTMGGGVDIGTVNPRDFTAESIGQFRQSGDFNQLKRHEPQRSAIKVDTKDAIEFYHPITSDLLKRIPKNLGPTEKIDYISAAEEAKLNQKLKMEPQIEARKQEATNRAKMDSKTGLAAQEASKRNATFNADQMNKATTQVSVMMAENQKLDKVIDLAKKGANTGPIMRYLPTLRSETIAMEQLQKEMGLDVVGAVTFGALSKGELDLALLKALPDNLPPEELIQWAKDKQQANRKLMDYMLQQVNFMRGGGTQAQWLDKVNQAGGISAAGDSGWTIEALP